MLLTSNINKKITLMIILILYVFSNSWGLSKKLFR